MAVVARSGARGALRPYGIAVACDVVCLIHGPHVVDAGGGAAGALSAHGIGKDFIHRGVGKLRLGTGAAREALDRGVGGASVAPVAPSVQSEVAIRGLVRGVDGDKGTDGKDSVGMVGAEGAVGYGGGGAGVGGASGLVFRGRGGAVIGGTVKVRGLRLVTKRGGGVDGLVARKDGGDTIRLIGCKGSLSS